MKKTIECSEENRQFGDNGGKMKIKGLRYRGILKTGVLRKNCLYKIYGKILKTLDTIGNCQTPVFSLYLSEHMHKITNL